jgi:lipopolysaccharide export LptBFGC system permease protein LptF
MKTTEKVMFAVLGTIIFFISGGVACTYGGSGAINPILAVILGITVFITAGAAACTYGNNRVAKQKVNPEA